MRDGYSLLHTLSQDEYVLVVVLTVSFSFWAIDVELKLWYEVV